MPLPVTHHGSGPYGNFVEPRGPRLALPLGPVNRDSGVFRTPRGATRDLRNVVLHGGTAHLRRGMAGVSGTFVGTNGAEATDVIGLKYLPINNTTVVVTYSRNSQWVDVFTVAGDGTGTPTFLGGWWSFPWDGTNLPVVTLAETANKVFMAHDEPVKENRAPTFAYSPQGGLPTDKGYSENFGPLRAFWDTGSLDDRIYFRGVVAYLDYLVGWGWGNNGEKRPEMVRISLPGEPIIGGPTNAGKAGFEQGGWVIAGSMGSPVISCVPAGDTLLILKPSATYPLRGYSPATFGVGPAVDQNFGIIGPNLWVNINGRAYIWTHEGPKMSAGGPLEDISLPLDLDGPPPDALQHIHSGGFGIYIPRSKVAVFAFDNWIYALDTETGAGGWSYWDLGVSLRAAEVLYQGGVSSLVVPGTGPTVNSVTGKTDTTITVSLNISGYIGGEKIQVWYRDQNGNNWVRSTVDEVTLAEKDPNSAISITEQVITVTGLQYATPYELAFRYDIQGVVHPDYQGTPGTWPASSRVTTSTAGMELLEWSRTSSTEEILTVTFVDHVAGSGTIEKSTDGGQTWVQVATGAAVVSPYQYVVQAGEGETYLEMRVLYTGYAEQRGRLWVGPPAPLNVAVDDAVATAEWYMYDASWTMGIAGAITKIWDKFSTTTPQLRRTTAADVVAENDIQVERNSPSMDTGSWLYWEFPVEVRHELTQFTVTDYSPTVTVNAIVALNDDETAQNTGSGNPATL